MSNTYLTVATVEEVKATLESSAWFVYARFLDREDTPIYDETGVRMSDGELWVNAGEWHHAKGYLNEEWLKPAFVYIKHKCDGCSYPPSMCCLQPQPRYYDDSIYQIEDWGGDYDDPNEDAYQIAYDQQLMLPTGVNPRTLVA